jgi:two-component system, NtrC family, response regulator AtoC
VSLEMENFLATLWKLSRRPSTPPQMQTRSRTRNRLVKHHLGEEPASAPLADGGNHIASTSPETSLHSMASTTIAEKIPGTDGVYEFALGSSGSAVMRAIEMTIAQVAPTNIPILLTGESGTGKERVALQIHKLSLRRNEQMVKVVCSSLEGDSVSNYFRTDDGSHRSFGTLFLEEISELSPASQRSLLYALPEADAAPDEALAGPRLISCTKLELGDETRAGRFRTELYFRINGVCLRLPPLRQRREDIRPLVELFLTKHSTLMNRPRPGLDKDDFSFLNEYAWPGNIRELENMTKAMVALNDAKSIIAELDHTSANKPRLEGASNGSVLKSATRAASRRTERELILGALTKTRWNRKRAAQDLQISYKSLLSKLKQIGAKEPDAT